MCRTACQVALPQHAVRCACQAGCGEITTGFAARIRQESVGPRFLATARPASSGADAALRQRRSPLQKLRAQRIHSVSLFYFKKSLNRSQRHNATIMIFNL